MEKIILLLSQLKKNEVISLFSKFVSTYFSVQVKANICSCCNCLDCNFVDCHNEQGTIVHDAIFSDDDSSDDSDEVDEIVDVQEEEDYHIRGSNVMGCISKDSIIALFTPPSSFELFYLCHVYVYVIALEDMKDDSDPV